jgi:hypothetical protein
MGLNDLRGPSRANTVNCELKMRTIKRKGVKLHSGFVFTQYPGKDYAEH